MADLGPRKIYKIFAGGNHSWVLLDDIIPVREKYRPPSPIKERASSLSQSSHSNTRSRSDLRGPTQRSLEKIH